MKRDNDKPPAAEGQLAWAAVALAPLGSAPLMHDDQTELDGQVLATLRAPTLSGVPAVMSPKRISHHIGHFITGTGWGPSPQAVAAALRRLAARGLVERAGRSRTYWTITSDRR